MDIRLRLQTKVGQVPIGATGCVFADTELLPALESYGKLLDQELFSS